MPISILNQYPFPISTLIFPKHLHSVEATTVTLKKDEIIPLLEN